MTRIDFYVVQDTDGLAKDLVVCRFVEKAFRHGHGIFVLTADADHSARLDEMLWTFSQGSFIPHDLYAPAEGITDRAVATVLIGHQDPPVAHQDILVTLCRDVPACFSRFQRVAEFVGAGDEEKQLGRDRYRFYRDRGYPLENHAV